MTDISVMRPLRWSFWWRINPSHGIHWLKQVEKGCDHRPRNSARYEQVVELFSERQKGHWDKFIATAGFMTEIDHHCSGNFEIFKVGWWYLGRSRNRWRQWNCLCPFCICLHLGSYFKFIKQSISFWYLPEHFDIVVMTLKYQHDTLAWLKLRKQRDHLPEYSFFFGQI